MQLVESTLKNLLDTEYDKKRFYAIFNNYKSESGSPNLREHLAQWAINKNHIYKQFGNKLKIEMPVESTISKDIASDMIRTFMSTHLSDNKCILAKMLLQQFLSTDEVVQNELKCDINFFSTKFSKGMKVSRILGRIIPNSISHSIQTAFSMLIQKFTVQGTAIISIDPVDYITMSVNKSGWRSCHALDGEYRTGTLAYMMDGVTAIAYVKTSECHVGHWFGSEYKEYSFDNKMWRQVVLFGGNYAVQSRQYPNTSLNNSEAISKLIQCVFSENVDGNLFDAEFKPFKTDKVSTERLCDLVHDECSDNLWYNDITHGSFSIGRLTYPSFHDTAEDFIRSGEWSTVIVGTDGVKCACGCGHWVDESETLFVESYCDEDDDYYEED